MALSRLPQLTVKNSAHKVLKHMTDTNKYELDKPALV
jgi:hypothetical protein